MLIFLLHIIEIENVLFRTNAAVGAPRIKQRLQKG